jgi:hypothetical protein
MLLMQMLLMVMLFVCIYGLVDDICPGLLTPAKPQMLLAPGAG